MAEKTETRLDKYLREMQYRDSNSAIITKVLTALCFMTGCLGVLPDYIQLMAGTFGIIGLLLLGLFVK